MTTSTLTAPSLSSPPALPPMESGQDPVFQIPIQDVRPSPENDKIYRPVDPDDREIQDLARSIRCHGVKEPLIVTEDRWIISGHRRYAAARLAGLESVPCRVEPFRKDEDHGHFMKLLRECNRQRVKSFDEKLREEIATANPRQAYQSLIEHRLQQSQIDVTTIRVGESRRRAKISGAKKPFLEAVKQIISERRKFWPLTDRQIHYALLNNPPLKHASKANSVYDNTKTAYKSLVDLLTRARLEGLIPMTVIADETRPVTIWNVHRDVQGYVHDEIRKFLKNYWRDSMQSQPNHVEILGEKNTVGPIIREISGKYCIPTTIGRGYCSLRPRFDMAERFRRCGKERLILLVLSDLDPDGEEIAQSFARSMRDDFGVKSIEPIKVALTAKQVEDFGLPSVMQAKVTSTNYKKFSREHGDDVFELEAVPPEALQQLLTEAIDSVIDVEAFNRELEQEEADAARLEGVRRTVQEVLAAPDLFH